MHNGSVTIESSQVGWVWSDRYRLDSILGWEQVYTLCRVVRSIHIVASSVMDMSFDSFVLMFWDFYLPL
jgi:hypothetical protein